MHRIAIAGTERHARVVAAVEDNGEWRMLLPFPRHAIIEAALAGDRIVCLSEEAELCLIDWRSGKEIARRHLPLLSYRTAKIFVTDDAAFIIVYHTKSHSHSTFDVWYMQSMVILRASDLETIVEGNAFLWRAGQSIGRIVDRASHSSPHGEPDHPIDLQIQGRIVEDAAGRLALDCSDFNSAGSVHGLCRIDRSDWSVHFEPIPKEAGPWRWFSASGRRVVAPHLGVPLTLGGSAAERAPRRDALAAAYSRNKAVLEFWTTDPPRLEATITTRGELPPEFITDVVWELDETGFWVKFGANSRRIEFQRVGLDGSLSPVFSFQRFRDNKMTSLQDVVNLSDPEKVEVKAFDNSLFIRREWCASKMPLMLIAEDEDGFRQSTFPYPPEADVKRFVASLDRRVVVRVQAFSEAAISEALRHLAREVSERLADLLQKDVLELSFKVGKRTITETAFFARLIKERIPVATALRELLTAYLAVKPRVVEANGFFRQLWGPEYQGALAPAMQALLQLDPTAHDVFRDYLAKRDGEHEIYSTDTIMKRYIEETGWRDPAMIRFGIYFALIRHRDGQLAVAGGLLDEYRLLRAAEPMIEADEFATMIIQEVDQFVADPGLERSDTKENLYLALQPSLEMTEYGRQALATIASHTGLALQRGVEDRGVNREVLQALRAVKGKQ